MPPPGHRRARHRIAAITRIRSASCAAGESFRMSTRSSSATTTQRSRQVTYQYRRRAGLYAGDRLTVGWRHAETTGPKRWTSRYNGPGNGDDVATALNVGPDGATVFVTGYSSGSGTSFDFATVAYDATTGSRQWEARYNGPGNGDDGGYALQI